MTWTAAACADINDSGVKINWSYSGNTGPSRWGQLSPYFVLCSAGHAQSPININKNVVHTSNTLTINYHAVPMDIIKDGETTLMLDHTQIRINDGHGIQLNFTDPHDKETLTVDGKIAKLVQLHIHTPSENQWHKQTYPMEIHFVHQGDKGEVVVMGVLVKGGAPNAALQTLIDHLPKVKHHAQTIPGQLINPLELLPAKHDYYQFTGSLTTPPCTEGVKWIVLSQAITASPAQIVQLRIATGANARPVQPLNGRKIFYSADAGWLNRFF